MSYVKTSWVARVGTALNRFLKANESSASVELTADPTGVSKAGTPFTADNMNKIEDGIYDSHYPTFTEASTLENVASGDVQETLWGKVMKAIARVIVHDGWLNQSVKTTASPTFANATINSKLLSTYLGYLNQGVKTTDSPTFAKLTLTTSTYGSLDIVAGTSWVFPQGIYTVINMSTLRVQIHDGLGGWPGSDMGLDGAIISDGSNVRVYNGTSLTVTIHYRKFS
jgi:hypothetical protein